MSDQKREKYKNDERDHGEEETHDKGNKTNNALATDVDIDMTQVEKNDVRWYR